MVVPKKFTFPNDIFKRIFFNENAWISFKIPLKFVPNVLIDNIPALGQLMAWCCPGDKSLSEPRMNSLPTHIYVTRPQWINALVPCVAKWQLSYWSCRMNVSPSSTRKEFDYLRCLSVDEKLKMLQWNLSITTTSWDTSLSSGAHLGVQGPPRWAPEGRYG